jgi:predicted MFS family arabinose efflux permease
MDNFLRLYAIYRTVPRWKVGVGIYKEAPKRLKLQLWVAKALFLIFAVLQYYLPTEEFYFFLTIVAASVWGMSFHKSIKIVFACEYEKYPEQMRYFGRDYQYLRYLQFKEKIIGAINKQSIEETIRFVSEHLDADTKRQVSSHPVVTFLLGVALAILGTVFGKLSINQMIASLVIVSVLLYFSYMILGAISTKHSDLMEFKRFLLWVRDEQS